MGSTIRQNNILHTICSINTYRLDVCRGGGGERREGGGFYKLRLWLDKRNNSLALIGQELLDCIPCPIRVWVCNNRSPLQWVGLLCRSLGETETQTVFSFSFLHHRNRASQLLMLTKMNIKAMMALGIVSSPRGQLLSIWPWLQCWESAEAETQSHVSTPNVYCP